MFLTRFAWTCWALVPVGLLAYHFGPGQRAYAYDRAASLHTRAARAEKSAAAAQDVAYNKHLARIDANRAAFLSQSPEDAEKARQAAVAEDDAYKAAAIAWRDTADVFGQIESVLQHTAPESLAEVRWSRSRALVRSGDIARGADDLEDLLDEFTAKGQEDTNLARSAREELATAYYYGARLMRLAGRSQEDWRAVSGKARQQFRYLAEQSRTDHKSEETTLNYQRNLELVLNLEQSSLNELQGRPMPRQSPRNGQEGLRPGNRKGKTQRPPRNRDGRGAGGAGEIGPGW